MAVDPEEGVAAAVDEIVKALKAARKKLEVAAMDANPTVLSVFRTFDTSGDGVIDAEELRCRMVDLGHADEAQRILKVWGGRGKQGAVKVGAGGGGAQTGEARERASPPPSQGGCFPSRGGGQPRGRRGPT